MKNSIHICCLTLLVSMLYSTSNYAQDLETWSTLGLEYKLNKKWSFALEEELRLKENSSEIDQYFTELSAEYDLSKHFSLGAGARFSRVNDNQGKIQGYENHLRFQLDASYKHKIDKLSLKYRLRYQNKDELDVDTDEAKEGIRFKTSAKYAFKNWKFDPEISAEVFNQFNSTSANTFDKYRLSIGTTYSLNDYGKINLSYQFEKEDLKDHVNIIGLKYTYTIKNK